MAGSLTTPSAGCHLLEDLDAVFSTMHNTKVQVAPALRSLDGIRVGAARGRDEHAWFARLVASSCTSSPPGQQRASGHDGYII